MIALSIIFGSIILAGMFAGMETGCYSLNKVRLLYNLRKKTIPQAHCLSKNIKNQQIFIFTMLICQNLFVYITSSIATNLYLDSGIAGTNTVMIYNFIPWSAEVAATITLTIPLFIFSEVIPKNLFRMQSDTLMYKTALFQRMYILLCLPLTTPLNALAKFLLMNTKKEFAHENRNLTPAKLQYYFSEGKSEGIISEHQNNMINSAMTMHTVCVKELLIAIKDVVSISIESSTESYLDYFRNGAVKYLTIYSQSPNNIIGIIDFYDALNLYEDKELEVTNVMKQIITMDENTNLQQAYLSMQAHNSMIAVIINNKNSVTGIISLKDLAKRIARSDNHN